MVLVQKLNLGDRKR